MGAVTYDFEGETAVVTAGSSGIGRAIARRIGEAGGHVVNADIREEPAGSAETPTHVAIEEAGGTATYVEADATDPAQLATAIDRASEVGGLDIMVNNAGGSTPASVREVTRETFADVWSVNVESMLFGCQLAAEAMIEREAAGTIVNTASIRSEFAAPEQVAYDAAKGAVKMLTRCAAFEFAEHGIRVNAVAPGPIATGGRSRVDAAGLREEVSKGEYTKPIPLGRAGEPHEVADAAVFLASENASYITGELLFVDGGYQIY